MAVAESGEPRADSRVRVAALAALAALAAAAPPCVWAQRPRPTLEATATPARSRLGDPVTVRVRVVLSAGATLADRAPRFRDTLPEWARVVAVDSLAPAGGALEGGVRLAVLRTGELRLPPLLVLYRASPSAGVDTAAAPPVAITVASVLPAAPNQSIKDIKGLERSSLARALRTVGRALAGVVALALVLAAAVFVLRRRRRAVAPAPAGPATPTLAPYDRALARLDEIEHHGQWRHRDTVDRHYQAVADVLRAYLAEAHAVPALERTTPELLALLPGPLDEASRRDALRALLREADLVKFARVRPAPDAARDYSRRARELLTSWRDAAAAGPAAPAAPEEMADALR